LRSESPTADRVQDQDDAVFMRSYIPRSLNEVYDPERDVARLKRGEGKDLIYGDLTGVVEANEEKTAVVKGEVVGGDVGDVSEEEESSEEEEESGEDGGSGYEDKKPRGKKHEDKESKKVSLNEPKNLFTLTNNCPSASGCAIAIATRRNTRRPLRKRVEKNVNTRCPRPRRRGRSKRLVVDEMKRASPCTHYIVAYPEVK